MTPPFPFDPDGPCAYIIGDAGFGKRFEFHLELLDKACGGLQDTLIDRAMDDDAQDMLYGRHGGASGDEDEYEDDDDDEHGLSGTTASVDVTSDVLGIFHHWLYEGELDEAHHKLQEVKDVLWVSQWNDDSCLCNEGFHDALTDHLVKLMTDESTEVTMDQFTGDHGSDFEDILKASHKFFIDWLVCFKVKDATIYSKFRDLITSDPEKDWLKEYLSIALLDAKAQEGSQEPPPWIKNPCKYHDHGARKECYRKKVVRDLPDED